MDSSSDDDIELLKTGHSDSNETQTQDPYDFNDLQPLEFLRRGPSSEESIPSASVQALQLSFSSLQRKLNEKNKKCNELQHENKRMKRALRDYSSPGVGNRCQVDMDDFLTNGIETNAQIAASGTSEDDTLAEQRANEGLIKYLRKENLVKENALRKTQLELYQFQSIKEDEQRRYITEIDSLKAERERLWENFKQLQEKTQEFQLRWQDEKDINQSLTKENQTLKEKLEQLEINSQANNDRNQSYSARIAQLENEIRTLTTRLENVNKERDALQCQIKQYKIESSINSNQQQIQRQQEEADDVDGDVSALKTALELVEKQREEYADLKTKVTAQASVIKQLTSRGKQWETVLVMVLKN